MFGLVAETSAFANHGRQQSLLPVLPLSESRARRCSHGPYILVWTQPRSMAFTGCWGTLLFHLDLVAGQPRRTSLAPFVCRQHKNFHVGLTAYEKFIHMLFFANWCFLSFRHINFHVFMCVHDCFSLQLTSVLLEPGVLELCKFRQSPGDTFGAIPQDLPAIVTRATIADAIADGTAPPKIGTRGRCCLLERLARFRNCIVAQSQNGFPRPGRCWAGRGWDGCRLPEPEESDDDATKWPCVGVVVDQGSD